MTPQRPWRAAAILLAAITAACNNDNNNTLGNVQAPGAPTGLVYQLNFGEQIGSDSIIEPGVLLSWLPPNPDSTITDFIVYGSDSTDSAGFVERAITTSISFHDAGQPQLQYYVTSQDVNGNQSAASNIVRINAGDTVQTPSGLTGTPLDSAALLEWNNNAVTGPNGSHFDFYRIYSEATSGSSCVANSTVLEGQSVSNGFVITGIANGVGRCYVVTAVTKSGHESVDSNIIILTPASTDPPFSANRVPANATVVAHHPIVLYRAHTMTRVLATK
jgi:hypothetical protein